MAYRPPNSTMKSRTYRTTRWLGKSCQMKGSVSSCTIVTKSKKGKVIYRLHRKVKPIALNVDTTKSPPEPPRSVVRKGGTTAVNGSLKMGDTSQELSGIPPVVDSSCKIAGLQAGKHKVKADVADEAQKHVVDKVSLPQFIDTSVPNVKVAQKSRFKSMKKCRSVEVRKVRRESNNLLNSVCCKSHKKPKVKTALMENKSLPELGNSNLYNFCSADNHANKNSIANIGTIVELRPKRIRFSSNEMVYPDTCKVVHGRSDKQVTEKHFGKVQGKEHDTKEGKLKMKSVDQKRLKKNVEKDLNCDDALDIPLEEVGDVQVFMKDAVKPGASGLRKTIKELFVDEIPGVALLGRTPELDLASDGVNSSVKHAPTVKNNACLFSEQNIGSGVSETVSKLPINAKENPHVKKEPEILSLRKNENLTIHKHSVKRLKKVNNLAYETEVIEKGGKTITKLKARKVKPSQNSLHVKSSVTEQGKNGENDVEVLLKPEGVSDSYQSSAISTGNNSSVKAPVKTQSPRYRKAVNLHIKYDRPDVSKVGQDCNTNKTDETHPLEMPGPTFEEIVNSMRLEADSFLKQSDSNQHSRVDEAQPKVCKKDLPSKECEPKNGIRVSSDQMNVSKESFLSKLKARVREPLDVGKNVDGLLRESRSVTDPPSQNSILPFGGRKGDGNAVSTAIVSGLSVPKVDGKFSKNLGYKSGFNKEYLTQGLQNVNERLLSPGEGIKGIGDFQMGARTEFRQSRLEPKSDELGYPRKTELGNEFGKVPKDNGSDRLEQKSVVNGDKGTYVLAREHPRRQVQFETLHDLQAPPVMPKPSFSSKVNYNPLNANKPLRGVGEDSVRPEQRRVTKKVFNSCKPELINDGRVNHGSKPNANVDSLVQLPHDKLRLDTSKKKNFMTSWFKQEYWLDTAPTEEVQEKLVKHEPQKSLHETSQIGGDSSKPMHSLSAIPSGQCGAGSLLPSAVLPSKPTVMDVAMKGSHCSGDTGCGNSKTQFQNSSSPGFACGGVNASAPSCKPVFPPIISNFGAADGCPKSSSCIPPCKPVFPPLCNTCDTSAKQESCGPKPSSSPPCCCQAEVPKYERPSVNFGPPSCCPPPPCCAPPPCCPPPPPCCSPPPCCAPSMKSKTYSVLDVSNMVEPPIPICISCIPKEKPCFPPKPPVEQNPSAARTQNSAHQFGECTCKPPASSPCSSRPIQKSAMYSNYSSRSWFDVTKTYLNNKVLSVMCLVTEMITNFLALIKVIPYSKKAEVCSTCVQSSLLATNQPLFTAASNISESLKPPSKRSKSVKKRLVRKKIRFIKAVKKSVHDDQSRQAILLEEERRKATGSKANPALAYSEVLNIVFNQKSEFPEMAKKQKRRSCMN